MMKWYSMWYKLVVAVSLGVMLVASLQLSFVLAQEGTGTAETAPVVDKPFEIGDIIVNTPPIEPILPLTYARIISQQATAYGRITEAVELTLTPTREIKPGFIYVSLYDTNPISYNNELWYQINEGEYLQSSKLTPITPSVFHGVSLSRTPETAFGWVVRKTAVLPTPGAEATKETPYLSRYTMVTIYETKWFGEKAGWHRIGADQWVQSYNVGAVKPTTRPVGIPAGQKWVAVDLTEQSLAAYNENDQILYGTLISSGLPGGPGWETPEGIFQIRSKVKANKMSGGGMVDWYFLEDVSATMYFTQSYAFHTAYWHDDFGRFKSHGCVNMTPQDAAWLFRWSTPTLLPTDEKVKASATNPGTWIWVHK